MLPNVQAQRSPLASGVERERRVRIAPRAERRSMAGASGSVIQSPLVTKNSGPAFRENAATASLAPAHPNRPRIPRMGTDKNIREIRGQKPPCAARASRSRPKYALARANEKGQ